MKNLIFYDLHGGHWFLSLFHPYGLYMLSFLMGYLILLGGRKLFEGRAYNIARSADIGDIALTGFVTIGSGIIQQPNFHPAIWMESTFFHSVVTILSVLVIIYFLRPKLARHAMDKFHAIVIAPIFFYFVVTVAPIYWCYGDEIQIFLGALCIFIWVALVVYDTKTGRLDQRQWISIHRPNWKFKN